MCFHLFLNNYMVTEKKKSSTCCLNVPSVTNVFCGMKNTVFGLNGRNLSTSPEKENKWCNQSFSNKTPRTVKKSTTSGGRTKEAKERSFAFVHEHGGDDVT